MSNRFVITIAPIDDEGQPKEATIIADVEVQDGRLVVKDTSQPTREEVAPLARTIRRKIQPKSGNQLFVS